MAALILAINLTEQVKEGEVSFDSAADTLAKALQGRDELTRLQIAREILRS